METQIELTAYRLPFGIAWECLLILNNMAWLASFISSMPTNIFYKKDHI